MNQIDTELNRNIGWDFDGELLHCPWSLLGDEDDPQGTGEVWDLIAYWNDWRLLGLLPFGSERIGEEPAWVVELIRICEGESQAVDAKALKGAADA